MICRHELPPARSAIIAGMLAITFCWLPASAFAITISGLYEAEVPVADQSGDTRKQAVTTALRVVLVKLTGDRNAPDRAALSTVMAQAERYLLQYRYQKDSSSPEPQAMNLWVQFDESALNDIMRNYGIPLWGKERPSILVWLASQGPEGRQYVNPEDGTGYLRVMEKRAQSRGVALIFPLLDLVDSASLKASDLWAGFREPVISASGRYQADVVLTGMIEQVIPSVWEARWTVYINEQASNWTTEGDLPEVVLDEGIDGLVDHLASRFADSGGDVQENTVDIIVSDVVNLDQYARTLRYLASLNSVLRVNVKRVEPGQVTFQLRVHGGEMVITQAIALGSILESTAADNYSYRLMPE